MKTTISLYEKFGGEEVVAQVVDKLYQLILSDNTINRFFNHTDLDKQRLHQTRFISFALGGPNKYTGKSMAKAQKGKNLQPEHFAADAKHLQDALAYFEVKEREINNRLQLVGSLKDDVLYQ